MNRVRSLPMPVLFLIAAVGLYCMVLLIALAIAWLYRTIGAAL
ncbi:hypothetical protein [Sphingomonas sp. T9W2]